MNLNRIAAGLTVILTSLFSMLPLVAPDTAPVTGSVSVLDLCGFTVDPTLDFGSVFPGVESATDFVTVTNTGSIPIDISLSGSDWTPFPGMPVGQTEYDLSLTPETPLTTNPALVIDELPTLPSNTDDIFFDVTIPSGQPTGAYTQDITVDGSCDP